MPNQIYSIQKDKILYWNQRLSFHTTKYLMAITNPYSVLGVNKSATQKEIKDAYYKLVKKYHPDQNKSTEATTKFKEIKDAYEILKDPQKKSMYDRGVSTSDFSSNTSGSNFNTDNPYGNSQNFYTTTNSNFSDIFGNNDIFSTLFGQGFGRQDFSYNNVQQSTIYQSEIRVSFIDAARGVTSNVTLTINDTCTRCMGRKSDPSPNSSQRCKICNGTGYNVQKRGNLVARMPCNACGGVGEIITKYCSLCHGSGTIPKTTTVQVKIPPGIESGQVVRQSVNNNIIDFVITVMKSNDMWREYNDIHSHLNVDFLHALTGGTVIGKTIHGSESVKISPGTSSHSTIRVPGKGISGVNGRHGAHVFHVKISIPKTLTATQKKLLKSYIGSDLQ